MLVASAPCSVGVLGSEQEALPEKHLVLLAIHRYLPPHPLLPHPRSLDQAAQLTCGSVHVGFVLPLGCGSCQGVGME